jgi:hypothetical protein
MVEIRWKRAWALAVVLATMLAVSVIVWGGPRAQASTPGAGRYCAAKETGQHRNGYVCAWQGSHRRWQRQGQATTPQKRSVALTATVTRVVTSSVPGPTVTVTRTVPAGSGQAKWVGITAACSSGGIYVLRFGLNRLDAGSQWQPLLDDGQTRLNVRDGGGWTGFLIGDASGLLKSGGEGALRFDGAARVAAGYPFTQLSLTHGGYTSTAIAATVGACA